MYPAWCLLGATTAGAWGPCAEPEPGMWSPLGTLVKASGGTSHGCSDVEEVWRSTGMSPQCALGGSLLPGCGSRLWFCFPAGVCLPVRCMLALPVTPCLSLFAFLCAKKCHIKASGAGNVPGRSPCWPGNRDEHSPCPQIPLLFPMPHPPSCLPPSPAQANL